MEGLPVGFRFYPTEEELLSFYLPAVLRGGRQDIHSVIPVVNVFDYEPWQLPDLAGAFCRGEVEQWLFFAPMQEREAQGGRPTRTTATGYWKATGSPTNMYSFRDNQAIGMKKTMVFYTGRATTGRKTKWKMNEYKAIERASDSRSSTLKIRHEFRLCRLYVTSGASRAFDRRPNDISLVRNAQMMSNVVSSSGSPTLASSLPERVKIDMDSYTLPTYSNFEADIEQLLIYPERDHS